MLRSIKNITVLMAVYNDSRYLKSSIKNILSQTYNDFEFLIIDDGSEDNAEEVVKSFKDSRINYKKIPHRGLAGALNYGLKISTGDWIARIDADDLNTLDRLETQVNFLKDNVQCDVVSSWSVYFEHSAKILFYIKPPPEDNEIKKFLDLHNPINHSSVIFDKRKILNSGGYNEKYKSYEDFELWFRLRQKLTFKIIPEVLAYTRLRKNSLTKTGSKIEIHNLLVKSALHKISCSTTDKEKKYWNNILFWIEYFYGKKSNARDYFKESVTLKKSLAFLCTFLPEKTFEEVLEFRIRQRFNTGFKEKKKFEEELIKLTK